LLLLAVRSFSFLCFVKTGFKYLIFLVSFFILSFFIFSSSGKKSHGVNETRWAHLWLKFLTTSFMSPTPPVSDALLPLYSPVKRIRSLGALIAIEYYDENVCLSMKKFLVVFLELFILLTVSTSTVKKKGHSMLMVPSGVLV